MTQYSHEAPISQILFGWTPRGGLGIRRHSSGLDAHQLELWDARLARYYRLLPTIVENQSFVPKSAFSYFEFSDHSAALLARFNNGESGRNNSHALVGPASALRIYAMYLSRWDGWITEDLGHTLMWADQSSWQHCLTTWFDDALLRYKDNRAPVARLVRAVLLDPSTDFTVLAGGDVDPLALLTLTRGVLDPVLSTGSMPFGWTFSTYEDSDTTREAAPYDDGSPRFWCIRSLPSSGQTGRHRVLVHQQIEDDRPADVAWELVSRYLRDPSQYTADIRDRLYGSADVEERVSRLFDGQPAMQPVSPRQAAPVGFTAVMRDPANGMVANEPAPVRREAVVSSAGPVAATAQVASPPAKPQTYAAPGATASRQGRPSTRSRLNKRKFIAPDADELFAKLAGEPTRAQKDYLLTELRSLWDSENPYDTSVYRKLDQVERQLVTNQQVLGATALVLLIVAILFFFTARRDVTVTVPPQPTSTVNVTPSIPTTAFTPPGNQPGEPPGNTRGAGVTHGP